MLQPVPECAWIARGGIAVSEPWEELELAPVEGEPDDFVAADYLAMNTGADGFLVSAFARGVLSPLLGEGSEFWPVRVLGRPYWWLNCMATVAALDRAETDADWSVVEGAWGSFSWITTTRRLAFDAGKLEGAPLLFRLPEYPQGILLARAEFIEAIEEAGLTGFRFDLIWSTSAGGVEDPPGFGLGDVFESIETGERERRREFVRELLAQRSSIIRK